MAFIFYRKLSFFIETEGHRSRCARPLFRLRKLIETYEICSDFNRRKERSKARLFALDRDSKIRLFLERWIKLVIFDGEEVCCVKFNGQVTTLTGRDLTERGRGSRTERGERGADQREPPADGDRVV